MKFNNGLNINAEPDMFVVAKKKKPYRKLMPQMMHWTVTGCAGVAGELFKKYNQRNDING